MTTQRSSLRCAATSAPATGGTIGSWPRRAASQAVEALRELKLRDEPVALVVSDQRMPDLSGTEVLKIARELFADVRTVLLTAYADTDVAITAINDLRLDYYILKPWDPPGRAALPGGRRPARGLARPASRARRVGARRGVPVVVGDARRS